MRVEDIILASIYVIEPMYLGFCCNHTNVVHKCKINTKKLKGRFPFNLVSHICSLIINKGYMWNWTFFAYCIESGGRKDRIANNFGIKDIQRY